MKGGRLSTTPLPPPEAPTTMTTPLPTDPARQRATRRPAGGALAASGVLAAAAAGLAAAALGGEIVAVEPVEWAGDGAGPAALGAAGPDAAAIGDTAWQPGGGGDGASFYTSAELEALVAPFALYPDDLLAIVLPAATHPLHVVQAKRYLDRLELEQAAVPSHWDDAVVALLNYPDVVALLDEDLDRTWRLGVAFLGQQADVLAAIDSFRERAWAAGNLRSDEHQVVEVVDDWIEIRPVERDVLYVPRYEPARVVVRQSVPVYHYYPRAYPVYYYPYPPGHRFSSANFWGISTWFSIGWGALRLNAHPFDHRAHPFYGYSYYSPWLYRAPRHRPAPHPAPTPAPAPAPAIAYTEGTGRLADDDLRWQPGVRNDDRPQPPAMRRPRYLEPRAETGPAAPPPEPVRRFSGNGAGLGVERASVGRERQIVAPSPPAEPRVAPSATRSVTPRPAPAVTPRPAPAIAPRAAPTVTAPPAPAPAPRAYTPAPRPAPKPAPAAQPPRRSAPVSTAKPSAPRSGVSQRPVPRSTERAAQRKPPQR